MLYIGSLGQRASSNLELNTSAKVHILKALIFLVIVYGYEIWTVKKSES